MVFATLLVLPLMWTGYFVGRLEGLALVVLLSASFVAVARRRELPVIGGRL